MASANRKTGELARIRPTWAEIDLDAFERNVEAIVKKLPLDSRLIAVLKADAYGHGAVELARRCRPERVAMIAVALLEEAAELRTAGIDLPILVLGPLDLPQIEEAASLNVTVAITGPEVLARVCEFARNREIHAALKLDSGMGRMGMLRSELPQTIEALGRAEHLRLDAIYTHFANAGDPHDPFTEEQNRNFDSMVVELLAGGIEAPLHRANSAGTIRNVFRPGEQVRVGIALYGAEALDVGVSKLEPVMRWRTEVARLKTLPQGHAIGYGETFRTSRESRIATLPVGYADGYNRLLSNRGEVLVRGKRAKVVGRVSMDLITIDVTDIDGVEAGDEVVLLGAQGDERVTAEEIASLIGTISYEVFCNVSARVPRVYREDGRVKVRSRFTE